MISIITCMYNASKYIKSYFDALEKQIDKDFEVLLIDDCSVDGSFDFAKRLIKSYSYKIYLYKMQENSGPGAARNMGLEHVTGNNILFVDIDDYIQPETIDILKYYVDYDCVFFNFLCFEAKSRDGKEVYKCKNGSVEKKKAIRDSLGAPWGKLFKTSIVKKFDVRFPKLMRSEDIVFCKKYLINSESFMYLPDNLYQYRISSTSVMHNGKYLDMKYSRLAMQELETILYEFKEEYDCIYIREIIYDGTRNLYSLNATKKEILQFWKLESEFLTWKNITKLNAFSFPQIIFLYIAKFRFYTIGKLLSKI